MPRLLLRQLLHRPGRIVALGLAILVAAAAFVLLTASASTSELRVRGTLTANFRGAYDILVRPRRSFTPLENRRGLVRDNYLSGTYGGITRDQYKTIKRLPGVSIAAPIANIGTVLLSARVTFPLDRFLTNARDQLLRVQFSSSAQRGLSRYPGGDAYIYYTKRRFFLWPTQSPFSKIVASDSTGEQPLPICEGFGASRPTKIAPFAPINSQYLACYTTTLSAGLRKVDKNYGAAQLSPRHLNITLGLYYPIALAAIDPAQESRLVDLRGAMVSGRYLSNSDRPTRAQHALDVPVIASSRGFIDEQLSARVQRLVIPIGTDVPTSLAAGACSVSHYPCERAKVVSGPSESPQQTAFQFITSLPPGHVLAHWNFSATSAFRRARGPLAITAYWTGAAVRYTQVRANTLEPVRVTNPDNTWINNFSGDTSYFDQPTDNLDVQFRSLDERRASNLVVGGILAAPRLRTVGTFDPARLPGFSALSRVPLETYYPPSLRPADAASKTALHGKNLLPAANIGDYVAQPPLLLTTLAGLQPFLDDSRFGNLSQLQERAPISVIRVRVAGVKGPDQLSQLRIKTVAQLIHDRTGLAVDITAGSSPTPITIALPAGKFGRPALLLTEGWVKKGVAVAYLRALDQKDAALFALILVVCVFFLGNSAYASVRTQRGEIGLLTTLGWSPAEIFRLVLGELTLIGFLAGALGVGLAAALVLGFSLDLPLLQTMLVLPIAILLSLTAGVVPAWQASRTTPLDAITPAVTGIARSRNVRGILSMSWINLGRLPGRTAIGAAGLVVGVAALTIMIGIQQGFHGTLTGTVLGSAVSLQIRTADFVALGLTLGLSAISAADVLYLNLLERRTELVTLETVGWSDTEIFVLIGAEALLLAAGASFIGAAVGVAVGVFVFGVGVTALMIGAALAGGVAAFAAFGASLLPILKVRALRPHEVLARE